MRFLGRGKKQDDQGEAPAFPLPDSKDSASTKWMRLPLGRTGAATTIIDAEDYDRVIRYRWYIGGAGYVQDRSGRYIHRLILNAPPGSVVDHINHDPLDNRRSNLRIGDKALNGQNRNPARLTGASGVRNVTWDKQTNKWRVFIRVAGKNINGGRFARLEDAALAAADLRRQHMPGSEEARTS
jgi:hypothetical protein